MTNTERAHGWVPEGRKTGRVEKWVGIWREQLEVAVLAPSPGRSMGSVL